MLTLDGIGQARLDHDNDWPPVNPFRGFDDDLSALMGLDQAALDAALDASAAAGRERHAALVMDSLATLYAHYFGYDDGPFHAGLSPLQEVALLRVRLALEREMIDRLLIPGPVPEDATRSVGDACDYLRAFVADNAGVDHPFFDFVAERMTRPRLAEFLRLEVIRNEVVDDEVALMIPGLQHAMKQVMTSNLWDECGNGKIDGFHTAWLRRLLNATDDWEGLRAYRGGKPWVASTTSNSLNSLLTRPGGQYAAYGHFTVTEGWVCPHFEKIVAALDRLGVEDRDVKIYFTAHINIDPHHTEEMITGILRQSPPLDQPRLRQILSGAHQAAAAGTLMYDRLLSSWSADIAAE